MTLVQEILQITNDKKSLNCFIKIIKNVPKNIVFTALSSLKIAMQEDYILRPGAYFIQVVKNYCPDLFNPKTCSESPLTKNSNIVVLPKTSKKQCLEPEETIVPASTEIAMEAINKIKLMLDKSRITN